jgi:hypothetical protein
VKYRYRYDRGTIFFRNTGIFYFGQTWQWQFIDKDGTASEIDYLHFFTGGKFFTGGCKNLPFNVGNGAGFLVGRSDGFL